MEARRLFWQETPEELVLERFEHGAGVEGVPRGRLREGGRATAAGHGLQATSRPCELCSAKHTLQARREARSGPRACFFFSAFDDRIFSMYVALPYIPGGGLLTGFAMRSDAKGFSGLVHH